MASEPMSAGMKTTGHFEGDEDRGRAKSRRWTDGLILAGALLVPILGATMTLQGQGRVALPGLSGAPLPTFCVARRLGFECATCGMTRSVIALMHGDWRQSLEFHRFGWWATVLILAQIPYRVCRLVWPPRRWPAIETCGYVSLVATAVLLLGNWLGELLAGYW